MADLYTCSSDGQSYPTREEMVDHQTTAHPRVEGEWTTDQMREDFEVLSFGYGLCNVRRRSDGQLGTLEFDHRPRIYRNFEATDG